MFRLTTLTIVTCITIGSGVAASAAPVDPAVAMNLLGVQGEVSFSASEIANLDRPFYRSDQNGDGYLSESEYISSSPHFRGNPQGARGFLGASDNNGDGRVSRDEYVQNRIITDEAKSIFEMIDQDTNWGSISAFRWQMTRSAFVDSSYLGNSQLASQLFDEFDSDNDGQLQLREYLVRYGRWARQVLPQDMLDGH